MLYIGQTLCLSQAYKRLKKSLTIFKMFNKHLKETHLCFHQFNTTVFHINELVKDKT